MTVVLVTLLGLFGMATNPILIGKAVHYADHAPTLASALSTSAFNVAPVIPTTTGAVDATGPRDR